MAASAGLRTPATGSGGATTSLGKPDQRNIILVVDDDPDLVDVTRFALENEGYAVETAENGKVALELLRAGTRPALVLLDLMMPVMNGWKFLEEIAGMPSLEAIPVVVLSAAGHLEAPPGAVAILRKPVELRSLVGAVERHGRALDTTWLAR